MYSPMPPAPQLSCIETLHVSLLKTPTSAEKLEGVAIPTPALLHPIIHNRKQSSLFASTMALSCHIRLDIGYLHRDTIRAGKATSDEGLIAADHFNPSLASIGDLGTRHDGHSYHDVDTGAQWPSTWFSKHERSTSIEWHTHDTHHTTAPPRRSSFEEIQTHLRRPCRDPPLAAQS